MKYLGMPIDEKKLVVSQWDPVEEKFEKKIVVWKGNMLSIGDRVTLVNACLSSISLYMLPSRKHLRDLSKRQICIEK
jgi:hypothetical protein